MRPVPLRELVERVFGEYRKSQSIFGIPVSRFYRPSSGKRISVFHGSCSSPMGPAAGPHTQLAQNIIAAYLSGGRFMELKTVQIMDTLEIAKPCIDARDECYNTEWSTEYTLTKAYDEYVKAWLLLHVLEELFELGDGKGPSFIFNMSVGYDLAGIKTERMDQFIERMIDSSHDERFKEQLESLEAVLSDGALYAGTDLEARFPALQGISKRIGSKITPSVTLSTMHGCPPDEIEAICSYMLTEKKIPTYVKLNPTLLGYDRVREILDGMGYSYLHLSREAFGHDLQWEAARGMLLRLKGLAEKEGLTFGVKLSNTLGSVNDQGALPGDEMYMSGRALYPLTINLAALVSEEFDGKMPISYAGGASAFNVKAIFEAGIRPITLATDMLKPGGYFRMAELSALTDASSGWGKGTVDVGAVKKMAQQALSAQNAVKDFRGKSRIETHRPLPLFDCYVAPCTIGCPIGQDVPEYVRLTGEGRYSEALDLIYEKNALPNITGQICDHQCQYNCTRLDYEGAVKIREMKRIAADNGWDEYIRRHNTATRKNGRKVAVVGAGPAGLSAAYFLAREGFDVKVFEKHDSAGGVVRHVIPHFRLPLSAIEKDVEFIKSHGVEFEFNVDPRSVTIDGLIAKGFEFIFLGVGAEKGNVMALDGSDSRVLESLDFLWEFRNAPENVKLGRRVVVVGGGNTAMDSARAALQVPGVEKVSVLYRRTKEQMPADLEEYDMAVEDGVEFHFLRNPESFDADGSVTCRVMELGNMDASGRRRPVATAKTETIEADTIITAIGETVDAQALSDMGLPLGPDGWPEVDTSTLETKIPRVYLGGDAQSGPSTIVRCVAAGRKAADSICRSADSQWKHEIRLPESGDRAAVLLQRKGKILESEDVKAAGDAKFAEREAARCLECNYVCNKCVEVCPNRANIVIETPDLADFHDPAQILHIDAYCNECGNCATFCPHDGRPYRDKFTIYNRKDDFENSANPGFFIRDGRLFLRQNGQVSEYSIDKEGRISGGFVDRRVSAVIGKVASEYNYLLTAVGE
ncbi:selenate reductase YgfK [Sediminispirochaeta smaragdinae DSM 11293]|uniref:Selenate reductase YgfK n=2 Tax=Sediminispirochaeta TaxID=1911556 RepID=E1R491_SEDSS|nr:selenate reductase YgfK [Sediminispirochaeta smaragdinae DSM 11293]